ncbi:MAG: sulfatase-like hydrolase/transferase [Clostridiales bacterium]|jgi:arylsulfatase A-like enzyme|nr:sulfatase-like hydrolase/transferase [Clostridiales bacterium]
MKPNILIINPDQMRADSMGHLGNLAAHTPILDGLAREGVSFSSAYCQNPVCVPSRCSFLTGLYPHVNGHRTMGHLLQPHEENLFGDMKQAGYHTVSSTRGDFMAGQYPEYHRRLIDEYIMLKRPKKPLHRFNPKRGDRDGDSYYSFFNGIIPTKSPTDIAVNSDDLVVDGVIRSIKKRPKDRPFFLFAGLWYPHPPYQIEKRYYDLIDKSKLPPRIPTVRESDGKPMMENRLRCELRVGEWEEARLDELRTVYLAMCAKVDEQVGRIADALREEGIYDDTALLFFSDHGDYTGDFGIVEKAQNCFPDCLTRVPFILKPPKGVPIGRGINDNLVELTDVCATVAALAGTEIERSHFSRNLLPTVADSSVAVRDYVCCEGGRLPNETQCMEYDAERFDPDDTYAPRLKLQADGEAHTKAVMLKNKRYKYVKRHLEKDEFYDTEKGERFNLIDDPAYAEQIETMRAQLLDWYFLTCDTVPKKTDERFMKEFLQNNVTSIGLPRIAGRALTFFLRVTGQTISGFSDKMRRKHERK